MKMFHRIAKAATAEMISELIQLGIAVFQGLPHLLVFEIEDSDQRWQSIQRWVVKHDAFLTTRTEFSQDEISTAKWLKLNPQWHHGYPQPNEDEFGYLTATYDLGDYCEQCDIGRVQRAAFQMRGEPKWGRRGMLQLNWVFDEFFATSDV